MNTTILGGYTTATKTAVTSIVETGSASAIQLNTLATTHALLVQDFQNIGAEAQMQTFFSQQSAAVNALEVTPDNISTILSAVQYIAPFQYADIQRAVAQITPAVKAALLAPNGLATALSELETMLQSLTSQATASGGTINVAWHGGPAHFRDAYCIAPYASAAFGLSAAIVSIIAPELVLGYVFGYAITYGTFFGLGAGLFGLAAFGC